MNELDVLIDKSDSIMATCTFCEKPEEKEVGKKGVCQICMSEIVEMFKDELERKSSKSE